MKFFLPFILVSSILLSCKEDHQQLCECIELGDQVNELSESFFNRKYSEAGKDSLDLLIEQRDKVCQPYLEMGATELQKAKHSCEQLNVEKNR